MKTINKIFAILMILVSTLVIMPVNMSFASDATAAIEGVKNKTNETSSNNYESLQGTIGKLLGFLQIASALVAVLVLAYTGFNYIVGTPDVKDEMKKKGVPIVVGFVLVFGATSIAKFLVGVAA